MICLHPERGPLNRTILKLKFISPLWLRYQWQIVCYLENIRISKFHSDLSPNVLFILTDLSSPLSSFRLLFFSFFWLDPKEPKGQDLPKLQPHEAERWLAGKSSHRSYPNYIGCNAGEIRTNFQIFKVCNGQNSVISVLLILELLRLSLTWLSPWAGRRASLDSKSRILQNPGTVLYFFNCPT